MSRELWRCYQNRWRGFMWSCLRGSLVFAKAHVAILCRLKAWSHEQRGARTCCCLFFHRVHRKLSSFGRQTGSRRKKGPKPAQGSALPPLTQGRSAKRLVPAPQTTAISGNSLTKGNPCEVGPHQVQQLGDVQVLPFVPRVSMTL